MGNKPREFTADEVKHKYLELIKDYVGYWEALPNSTTIEKLQGLVFSILVILDGESTELPGFIVAPLPHPDDAEYCKESGKNWFPDNTDIEETVKGDISGGLHNTYAREYKVNGV